MKVLCTVKRILLLFFLIIAPYTMKVFHHNGTKFFSLKQSFFYSIKKFNTNLPILPLGSSNIQIDFSTNYNGFQIPKWFSFLGSFNLKVTEAILALYYFNMKKNNNFREMTDFKNLSFFKKIFTYNDSCISINPSIDVKFFSYTFNQYLNEELEQFLKYRLFNLQIVPLMFNISNKENTVSPAFGLGIEPVKSFQYLFLDNNGNIYLKKWVEKNTNIFKKLFFALTYTFFFLVYFLLKRSKTKIANIPTSEIFMIFFCIFFVSVETNVFGFFKYIEKIKKARSMFLGNVIKFVFFCFYFNTWFSSIFLNNNIFAKIVFFIDLCNNLYISYILNKLFRLVIRVSFFPFSIQNKIRMFFERIACYNITKLISSCVEKTWYFTIHPFSKDVLQIHFFYRFNMGNISNLFFYQRNSFLQPTINIIKTLIKNDINYNLDEFLENESIHIEDISLGYS